MPKLSRLPFFNYRAQDSSNQPYYQPERNPDEVDRINRVLHGRGDPTIDNDRLGRFLFSLAYMILDKTSNNFCF